MTIQIPPSTILTNTSAIIRECEVAEVNLNTSHTFILVTELAALIHSGDFTSAHHLYQRYQDQFSSNDTTTNSSTVNTNDASNSSNQDLNQFQQLWNAVSPLFSLLSHQLSNNDPSILISSSTNAFYTNIQSCINTQQQPLATYANELRTSHQMKMMTLMESMYDSIPITTCHALLGISTTIAAAVDNDNSNSNGKKEDIVKLIAARKWETDGDYYIPAESSSGTMSADSTVVPSGQEKIEFLTHVVAFMEQQRMNT